MPEQEDATITKYYSLMPTQFHDLIRFELKKESNGGVDSIGLEIDLRAKESQANHFLRLKFFEVSELKYNPGYWSFAFIDVTLDEQAQEARYRVYETEQDTEFSLFCRELCASLCEVEVNSGPSIEVD